ncbi:MAG: helix-hairpin-helix domain-containing protein [Candidatus Thorarchaeota archaeon]
MTRHKVGSSTMLHYREFPARIAATFLLFAAPFAFDMFLVTRLVSGNLFSLTYLEHQGLLGMGALAAVVVLPLVGFLSDRVRSHDPLLLVSAIITPLVTLTDVLLPGVIAFRELVFSMTLFGSLAGLALFWALRLNQSIVARYRGRTVALFLLTSLMMLGLYRFLGSSGVLLLSSDILLPAIFSVSACLIVLALRPWKFPRATLGVAGSSVRYFTPMVFVLMAYMLWFFVTKLSLADFFSSDPSFESLSQFAGLGLVELVPLGVGALLAGLIADLRDRKTAFSFMLLLLGLLTIFGSAFYTTYFDLTDSSHLSWLVLLQVLLVSERFIEGFMLGLCLFLIWPELGSVKTKGLRLSLIWFFFLGFMTLFWAVDLNATVFGLTFSIPGWLPNIGGQVAILSSLIALYLIGSLPDIIGREIEMEDLTLDFDERQVRRTVDAFVGADDFDSIRSQIDIMEATEVSDSDMSAILGEGSEEILPLRSIPGIGVALEKKLKKAGYKSAVQLAGETAQRLATKIDGLTPQRAEKILKATRTEVKKTLAKKS